MLSLSFTDYGNLNMVVPPRTPRPDAFILILYYTDVEETGGPTCLARSAPGELTSYDLPFNPPNNHPGRSPELLRRLYKTERPIRYKPGTCALYRLDSWYVHSNSTVLSLCPLRLLSPEVDACM